MSSRTMQETVREAAARNPKWQLDPEAMLRAWATAHPEAHIRECEVSRWAVTEIDRLRAALRTIATRATGTDPEFRQMHVRQTAREALGEPRGR